MICGFLDESGRLFSHRILSRDECLNATSKKDNLKSLFTDDCGDAMVCIIDDREDVWNHATNLIQVKPYHFFQHTGDINAPPGLAKKELDGKGVDFNKVVKLQKFKGKQKSKDENEPKTHESSEKPETDGMQVDADEDGEGKNLEAEGESEGKKDNEKELEKMTLDPGENSEKKDALDDTKKESLDSNEQIADSPPQDNQEDGSVENQEDNSVETQEVSLVAIQEDNLVEIQDPDDYLLYLEAILKQIHESFYETYDKTKEISDLKVLIPKLKSQVLVGVSIVFSGLVPSIVKLEHSRPYLIAKNLGAEVTEGFTDKTTHLVAASTGTQKVFQAQKNKAINVVTPEWLWTCAERWEYVDEKLFPLSTNRQHRMRQVPAHCSPERIPEPDDVKFNNPYLQMSDCDIAQMEAEVDDSSESEDDNAPPEAERPRRKRKRSLAKELEEEEVIPNKSIDLGGKSEDIESISSDSGKSGKSSSSDDDDDEESPSTKFRRGKSCANLGCTPRFARPNLGLFDYYVTLDPQSSPPPPTLTCHENLMKFNVQNTTECHTNVPSPTPPHPPTLLSCDVTNERCPW